MILEELIFNIDKKNRLYLPFVLRDNNSSVVVTYINPDTLIISNSNLFNVENFIKNVSDKKLKRKFIRYLSASSFLLNIDRNGAIIIPSYILKRFSFFEECVIIKMDFGFLIRNKAKYLEERGSVVRKLDTNI